MPADDTASLVFTGPHKWSTFSVFNGNAFPEDLASIVKSCAVRLAVLSAARVALDREIEQARTTLLHELKRYAEGLPETLAQEPVLRYIGYSDGTEYLGTFYSALHSSRSFLDVYAMLMGKLIGRQNTWSFKRAKVDGTEVPGGSIINWLHRSAPAAFTNASALRSLVLKHSKDWIGELTDFRDTFTHYSEIRGFTHMNVPLMAVKPGFFQEAISGPSMPNGAPIPLYVEYLMHSIRDFIKETIMLLPSVDMQRCTPDQLFKHG